MSNVETLSEAARREFFRERQCTAHNRQGERCKRAPIIGGTVCDLHGGKVPLTRQAAQRRLAILVEPAIEALHRVLDSVGPPCEHCGRSDADVNIVQAAKAVLDRTGYSPRLQVELCQPDRNFADLSPDGLIAELERMLAEARAMRDRQPPAIEGEVLSVSATYAKPPEQTHEG